MKTALRAMWPALMIGALSACGGNEGASNQTAEVANAAMPEENMMAPMSGPFADSEMRMNEQMMAAVGSDVGQNWTKKMIAHHQGAVDMSREVLDQNPTAEVAKMARETIAKNEKDIASIRKFVKEGNPDQRSAELYRPSMMDMHQKMMAASGSNVSETYMRKMLEHHKGAVTMSDVALANGVSGALRGQVQKTRSENQKDAEMTEAMLRGEPMPQAKAEAGTETSPAANRQESAATNRTSSGSRPSTPAASSTNTAAPANQTDPHAGHDMNKM